MIPQTTSLVVGVDGTDRSRDALALASRLTDPDQPVLLTHAHSYGRLSSLLSTGEYEQLVREVAESTFAAVQETLAPAGRCELRLVSNPSPAAGLQQIARETNASIVVGSSHAHDWAACSLAASPNPCSPVRRFPSPSLRATTAA